VPGAEVAAKEQAEHDAQPAKPAPPPFEIVRSEHADYWMKLLLYAAYGAGKTTLAAGAYDIDEMNDVLFIDAEGGTLVLPEGVDLVRIKRYEQMARVKDYLRLHCRYRDEGNIEALAKLEGKLRGVDVKPEDAKMYRTVVVDSLTEVYQFLQYMITGIDYETQALDLEPEGMEGSVWNKASEMTQLLVRTLRDLPMHVIVVCSEQDVETGGGEGKAKKILKRPNLPGKLGNKVQGFLNTVAYLEVAVVNKEVLRRLWLQQGHPRFQAKMRLRREQHADAPRYLDDPHIGDLLELTRRLDPSQPLMTTTDTKESESSASTTTDTQARPHASPSPSARRGRRR
jgi:hypothetical protein